MVIKKYLLLHRFSRERGVGKIEILLLEKYFQKKLRKNLECNKRVYIFAVLLV